MGFRRRFVYLTTANPAVRTSALRRVDMSRFFRPTPIDGDVGVENVPLPEPTLSFHPPNKKGLDGKMDFFLFKKEDEEEEEGKVVAADNKGRSLLYDLDLHAVRAMPKMKAAPKFMPISLTVGDSLYVLDRIPTAHKRHGFEALTFSHPLHDYGDWSWGSRQLPPFVFDPDYDHNPTGGHIGYIDSYAVVAGGSSVCISTRSLVTYSFDTKTRIWTKSGSWDLPFSGLAEYVPEHKLWFGMASGSSCKPSRSFCASDLAAASELAPPRLHGFWNDATPDLGGKLVASYALHLGKGRFCIARFLKHASTYCPDYGWRDAETVAVFTGVEVERHGQVLHAIKHKSERYRLSDDEIFRSVF